MRIEINKVTYSVYDDHWVLVFLLDDIAVMAAMTGQGRTAFELLGAADVMREEIISPRNPTLEEELSEKLSAVHQETGEQQAEAAQRRGRQHSITSASRRGLQFTWDDVTA
ncbi:MAG: hypothetical protein GY781_01610 [Gammaproteobacteria bacterium]|nr:hypothetical protein [Gammaproteobacteria bacterium]